MRATVVRVRGEIPTITETQTEAIIRATADRTLSDRLIAQVSREVIMRLSIASAVTIATIETTVMTAMTATIEIIETTGTTMTMTINFD